MPKTISLEQTQVISSREDLGLDKMVVSSLDYHRLEPNRTIRMKRDFAARISWQGAPSGSMTSLRRASPTRILPSSHSLVQYTITMIRKWPMISETSTIVLYGGEPVASSRTPLFSKTAFRLRTFFKDSLVMATC